MYSHRSLQRAMTSAHVAPAKSEISSFTSFIHLEWISAFTTPMSIVLKNQVESSERSADQLELLTFDHAATCRDVEALMHQIVDVFAELNAYVERWQVDIERGITQYTDDGARDLLDLYIRLEKTAVRASLLGRTMERWGFVVAGKNRFINAWRTLKGITCFSLDRVAESFKQIAAGNAKPLEEFMNELSSDPER